MRDAVRADAATLAGMEVCKLYAAADDAAEFRRLAAWADFTLVIAPEFDGLLDRRCRWVAEAGGRLLGPAPAAVRLTADKWALYQTWSAAAVPTPATALPGD